MSGTDVMELQALLKKMGYNPGEVDGLFGGDTRQAVMRFQRDMGLTSDGIVGPKTREALNPFYLGYLQYTVKPGDTFYNLARKQRADLDLVLAANPGVEPGNLQVGQKVILPFPFPVVDTNISYTYEGMERDILGLKARYPFLETGVAGKSVLGKNLYYLRLGAGSNQVFYNAAHHSLEWITSPLLMKFAEDFLRAYALGRTLKGYDPREIWNISSIYLVPMVNPDGVDLVLNGLKPGNPYYEDLIRWNGGSDDFSSDWQANNRGVDLNHNYNAAWEASKEAEAALGITGPGPTRYSGPGPESEPETRTMVAFTRDHDFRLAIAYHTQGRVIYWNFMDLAPPEAKIIGQQFAAVSGYTLEVATGIASYAGYKDWFIQEYRRPGYTVEVGLGKNPIPISQFDTIYKENLGILLQGSII
ncbi:M14 family metallopeptidase [Papillibacter cinnamivorans]|uniref:G-D-glutamyl-meso-diaminopimelate peptidase n=1 Tax=Papillibacter cinnamivorans DSM 12816 TaxID=1122930 RepID=A0A1W1ZZ31_9FIRM|nr:M14 family metallopeptidase [Papillibacter cinnamivorans]SMC53616.1 g-D-glutamyl-meso-diaminopimelate peptidase [Papillibacter cinnamivorans DSM 12816]